MKHFLRHFRAGIVRAACTVVLLLVVTAAPMRADLAGPKETDQYISYAVGVLLRTNHLSRRAVDDDMSQRAFDLYLKTLDPLRVYFNQSDIDEFRPMQKKLDDRLRQGNISFAYKVFNRLLRRIDERVKYVDHWLGVEHDFTADEELLTDREDAPYPKNEADARELWRKRVKYDLLTQKADKKTDEEAREKVKKRYHSYAKRMKQTDSDELLEMYLTALTSAYDPHTSYMSPSTLENFDIVMSLKLDGIGAQLTSEDGVTTITKIIPGGAAGKDGRLKPKDRIVGVGQGESGEIVDTVDMKLNDVVHLIRGKRDTVVRLQVIPAGKSDSTIYKITRAKIELRDSEARGEVIELGKRPDGKPYKIGVIDLPSFYMDMDAARRRDPNFKSTTRDVKKKLDEFRANKVDALILDLRKNGGGSLTEAINLTGLFIDEGAVVQIKDHRGDVVPLRDEDEGTAWDGPLMVLTSKLSASASEIFAGAIQDYGRGIIVGDPATHGKGTVQSLMDLNRRLALLRPNDPKLGALKLTIQQFYRPSGASTQQRGVLADIVLPSLIAHLDVGEGDLDYAMKFDRVPRTYYEPVNFVNKDIIKRLAERSTERLGKSKDFKKEVARIDRYKKYKESKKAPLNEKKFLARRAALDVDTNELLKEDDEPKKGVVKRDYYFNEALAIAVDYVEALNARRASRN